MVFVRSIYITPVIVSLICIITDLPLTCLIGKNTIQILPATYDYYCQLSLKYQADG